MWKLYLSGLRSDRIPVSVPLRGLDMWKQFCSGVSLFFGRVSVPLRGLDMWKQNFIMMRATKVVRFSPLAGIRYVETLVDQQG